MDGAQFRSPSSTVGLQYSLPWEYVSCLPQQATGQEIHSVRVSKNAHFVLSCLRRCNALAVYGTTNFGQIMSRDRWHRIRWNLAVTDPELDAPDAAPTSVSYDRLWKIRPVLEALSKGCTATAKPGRNVTLDEMMIKCKGEGGEPWCTSTTCAASLFLCHSPPSDVVVRFFARPSGVQDTHPHQTHSRWHKGVRHM